MRYIEQILLFLFLFLASCQKQERKVFSEDSYTIHVSVSKEPFSDIAEYLKLSKLVRLDDEPLVAPIKDIEIVNDRIVVLDITSRILCYDMNGKNQFVIDAKGSGPGEYSNIGFFSVDEKNEEIWLYDYSQAMFYRYSLKNGKFLKRSFQRKPAPVDVAFEDGMYYYDSPDHRNYMNDRDLHYSLLVSEDGKTMEKTHFPHDDAEHDFGFLASGKSFYRSGDLLYCKNFSRDVYALNGGDIHHRYEFVIPDWLSHGVIERRMDIRALLKSDYAYGLCDIFECNGMLSFRFSKSGFIYSGLYDLKEGRQVYCAPMARGVPGSEVPIISAIVGAYQSQFVSVLSLEYLYSYKKQHPNALEEILPDYDADDGNPVIAFYDVVRSKE